MTTNNFTRAATDLLGQCEREMQNLLAEAVSARDYDAVMLLTGLAKALREMAGSGGESHPTGAAERVPAAPKLPAAPAARKSAHRASSGYPHFVRRGNSLIKIGWSKREKRPYQHRIARKALDAVVTAVERAGAGGKVFTVDDILPVTDPGDGAPVSDYLVYVGLAWLRQVGLIDQHGRQGYSIPKIEILTEMMDAAWEQLPEG
jgi:hypothetical protein